MPFAILALVALILYCGSAHGASLRDLPFLGGKNPFKLEITGDQSVASGLEEQLETERSTNSELRQLTDRQSIARYEADILNRYLRSKGYYDTDVTWDLGARIEYRVNTGPVYRIHELTLQFPPINPELNIARLRLQNGQPLDAGKVLAALKIIEEHYAKHSCLYEIKATYDAKVNHANREASLSITLAPSEPAVFGSSNFIGSDNIDDKHLVNYLNYEPGECFRRKLLDESRLSLLQSGLLASTDIEVLPLDQGKANLIYRVTERRPHTIKGGVSYDGDAGAGLSLDWEHRNLLDRGEKLALTSEFSKLSSQLGSQITVPHFLAKTQNLVLHANLERETPDAFTSTKAELGATLNRRITPFVTLGLGFETLFSRVEADGQQEDYGLLGVPFTADINRRDDIFDPREGWNLGAKTEAFWDAYHTEIGFQKSTLAGSVYYSKNTWRTRPTLALRLATGVISGEALDLIPADERFYVGGGGSVRGYTYQSLGNLTDGKADGGLSFGETSMELRMRFSRTWGGVVFVDGGLAYAEEIPTWGQDFLWGAGIGLRYYTSFAPIRLDIAAPLNRRAVDDPVQLYISIGQAF